MGVVLDREGDALRVDTTVRNTSAHALGRAGRATARSRVTAQMWELERKVGGGLAAERRRVEVAPSDRPTVVDHEPDALRAEQRADVGERVAVDHDEVGYRTRLEASGVGQTEGRGTARARLSAPGERAPRRPGARAPASS